MFEPCTPLGDYQSEAIQFLNKNRQAAIFLPMGTGKTFCVIESLKMFKRVGIHDAFPVIIFAPKIVCHSWVTEIQRFGNGLTYVDISNGPSQKRLNIMQDALADDVDIFITNYEFAPKMDKLFTKLFGTVICDESTRIKNPKAQRSKAVYEIARCATYRRILTGSPITRGLEDIYGQAYCLDQGDRLGSTLWKFYNRYFSPIDYGPGQRGWVPKSGSTDRVKSVLRDVTFKKDRTDCYTLPDKRYVEIKVAPSAGQRKAFREITDYWRLNGREMFNALAIDSAMRQVACGFIMGDEPMAYPCEKYIVLPELIQDAGEDSRVVVWTNFRIEQQRTIDILRDEGISCAAINGSTPHEDRTQHLMEFRDGHLPVIVISEQVGAFGLNELADADLIVYMSNSYDLELRKQSEDRTYRAGRKTSPVYYDLIVEGSIEEHILEILKSKHQLSKEFMRDMVLRKLEELM